MTGNTLGLWGTFTTPPGFGPLQAGYVASSTDGIGAFISFDPGLTAPGEFVTVDFRVIIDDPRC